MRATFVLVLVLAVTAAIVVGQTRAPQTLDIYVVDVEGGNAVLFVPPSGESVLIDTGNGGAAAMRDVDRMMAAVNAAGVKQIDHLITTHYHGDHIGGVSELSKRIPIREFIDHGPTVEASANAALQPFAELYAKAKHTIVKPGDRIPINGLDWRVVSSAGEVLKSPLSGAGSPNPYCANFKMQDVDRGENAQSVGSYVTFGRFRVVHMGDLT